MIKPIAYLTRWTLLTSGRIVTHSAADDEASANKITANLQSVATEYHAHTVPVYTKDMVDELVEEAIRKAIDSQAKVKQAPVVSRRNQARR